MGDPNSKPQGPARPGPNDRWNDKVELRERVKREDSKLREMAEVGSAKFPSLAEVQF